MSSRSATPTLAQPASGTVKSFLVRWETAIRWTSLALIVVALLFLMRALPAERLFVLLQSRIDELGMWGPLILGLLYVVATLLFVPGWILTVAAGALYGLPVGTITVSLGSTAGAALAFLIARYLARDAVRRRVEQSPRLAAVDEAIGEQGWKIVALLRLSPAVPFNLQNYLYGVTAIRFWPYVLTSWLAMLPGTLVYVYLGSLGRTAALGETTAAEWVLRGVGLLAIVAVTVYLARLAYKAIRERTHIEESEAAPTDADAERKKSTDAKKATDRAATSWPWGTLVAAIVAVAAVAFSVWAFARPDAVRRAVERLLGMPPSVDAQEVYEEKPGGPTFDHSAFERLLQKHVDADGWVDYEGLQQDEAQLGQYLEQLAAAPFDALGRDEKLALLINAYNAFTLQLILDYYPVNSIKDIPAPRRWDDQRWQIGRHTWSLNQIEHEEIRPKFREPRIHFVLVCAAVGCPPLKRDAYTGEDLEEQLAAAAGYVHAHPRWFRFDADRNVVNLTELYSWYRGDFEQQAATVLDYAAQFVPELQRALDAGRRPRIEWIKYNWTLNSRQHKQGG